MRYGTGSLRSDVANIKNDITCYCVTSYASKKFGDWKVVGELAYLQSKIKSRLLRPLYKLMLMPRFILQVFVLSIK